MTSESIGDADAGKSRRWIPLAALLVLLGIFDLAAMVMPTSLTPVELALVMAVVYTQSMLSAVWLGIGIGTLAGRGLVAALLLLASSLTMTVYILHGIGADFDGATSIWLVPVIVTYVIGLWVHWGLCVIGVLTAGYSRWQLTDFQSSADDRLSNFQFGLRSILIFTALFALTIAAIRVLAGMGLNTDVEAYQWEFMMLSVAYSSFCAPLQLLCALVLMSGQRIHLRLLALLAVVVLLTGIELEVLSYVFGIEEQLEFIVFNAGAFVLTAALAIAARRAGLRLQRRRPCKHDAPASGS